MSVSGGQNVNDWSYPHRTKSRGMKGPGLPPTRRRSRIGPGSPRFVLGAALGVGVASFLTTELMHYLLVPDVGRHQERLLAESLSAFIVSCLIAKLAHLAQERHRLIEARMQVIAEMNHHIRNAMTSMWLTAQVNDNRQFARVISEGVNRIDWALREILPREAPLGDAQRHRLGYFQTHLRNSERPGDVIEDLDA
jgi:signal transduction histidine kinase